MDGGPDPDDQVTVWDWLRWNGVDCDSPPLPARTGSLTNSWGHGPESTSQSDTRTWDRRVIDRTPQSSVLDWTHTSIVPPPLSAKPPWKLVIVCPTLSSVFYVREGGGRYHEERVYGHSSTLHDKVWVIAEMTSRRVVEGVVYVGRGLSRLHTSRVGRTEMV